MKFEKNRIKGLVNSFRGKNVLVVGDLMLDSYIFGRVFRINPERAGYPLLNVEREEFRLGGAANVAVNLSTLGAKVDLMGAIGNDKQGEIMRNLCGRMKVNLVPFIHGETLMKQRWIESSQKDYFGRADFGEFNIKPLPESVQEDLIRKITNSKPDVVILSDYNKVVFTNGLAQRIIRWSRKNGIKVIVDPKPQNIDCFKNAYLLCHNNKEARAVAGAGSEKLSFKDLVKKVRDVTQIENLTVTLGADGMISYDGEKFNTVPTQAKEVVDVTGAGDTATAVLALAVASGASLPESMFLGNIAAGIVCNKVGTATVTNRRLLSEVDRQDFQ